VDVCIVGGGLAGITAGLSLVKSGVSVTLLEADSFTNYRAGEHVAPQAIELLKELDLPSLIWESNSSECLELKSTWGSEESYNRSAILNPLGSGLVVNRPDFDEAYLEYSESKGLKAIRKAHVTKIEKLSSNWKIDFSLNGTINTIYSNWVIDASGRNSKFSNTVGVSKTRYDRLVALSSQFSLSDTEIDIPIGSVQIKACPYGWWYVCRLSKHNLIISLFTDPDIAKAENISKNNFYKCIEIADPFSTFKKSILLDSNIRTAQTQALNRVVGNQWIATGDAAWSADPLSSQGMYKAILSGREAARALVKYLSNDQKALEIYNNDTRSLFLKYLVERANYYRMEQRWASKEFWIRRHHTTWLETPIKLQPTGRVDKKMISNKNYESVRRLSPGVDLNLLNKTKTLGLSFSEWVINYKNTCKSPPSDREIIIAIQELIG